MEGKTETSVKTTTYERLNELNYAEKMLFTNSTSGVKVIVTDNVGRTTTATTKACVNMYYVEDIPVATAPAGDGAEAAGGAKRLLSLGDQKTYSVQECLENTDLQSHADVKVYYMNGNAQSVRIYSMENADGKNAEYSYNGQNIGSFGGSTPPGSNCSRTWTSRAPRPPTSPPSTPEPSSPQTSRAKRS